MWNAVVGKKNYNIEKHTNNINTVYFINIAEDNDNCHPPATRWTAHA